METVIRGAAVYLFLVILMRLSGRRTLSEATPFDFILLLIIAETTQQALLGNDFSLTNAAVLIITLIGIDIGLSYVKEWSPTIARLLDGLPTVLVRNGKVDRHALRRTRLEESDIMVSARQKQGIGSMDEVEHAVLETDSGISVIPKKR